MNNKLPILIAATIGLSILTTGISVNSAVARCIYKNGYFGGMGYGGYGGMGYGGAGPVIQEPVDTGSPKQLTNSTIVYRTHMRTHQLYKK